MEWTTGGEPEETCSSNTTHTSAIMEAPWGSARVGSPLLRGGSLRGSWRGEYRRGDWKLPHADSGQNSLEYWDYSVELEMLKGPEDLQLAAELGKTLLERNRELEATIRHQQNTIEDHLQEIEYLSKQTAALREVNDSRLRIYEQLEVSVHDLERTNQRLGAEGAADKRRIKSLTDTIEQLELRIEELQQQVQGHEEEGKGGVMGGEGGRGRNPKRRSLLMGTGVANGEDGVFRRSLSCENSKLQLDEVCDALSALEHRHELLQQRLKQEQEQRVCEARRREDLEIELACVSQENGVLLEQLAVLKEKEVNLRPFEEELASLDDTTSEKGVCRKCLGLVEETSSNPTVNDPTEDFEDETAISSHGGCALVRLRNGGYAWGSQESLASMGQVMTHMSSTVTSPGTETSDAPHNSLLSELDTQYRILIEKYEALLDAREHQQEQLKKERLAASQNVKQEFIHSGVDEMSGPMSLVVAGVPPAATTAGSLRCQRCTTCTCDLKAEVLRPKSNMEEFSEVETSSSGFSDGESRLCSRATQTTEDLEMATDEVLTPTPLFPTVKYLDLTSPVNPCNQRFQTAPEYKQLFQEIFSVLKKSVNDSDTKSLQAKTSIIINEHLSDTFQKSLHEKPEENKCNTLLPAVENVADALDSTLKLEDGEESEILSAEEPYPQEPTSKSRQTSTKSRQPSTKSKYEKSEEILQEQSTTTKTINNQQNQQQQQQKLSTTSTVDQQNSSSNRPPRPDTLNLQGSSTRSSSRQQRKTKRRHRNRHDSSSSQVSLPSSTPSSTPPSSNKHKPNKPSPLLLTHNLSQNQQQQESQKQDSQKQESQHPSHQQHKQKHKDHHSKKSRTSEVPPEEAISIQPQCKHRQKKHKHKVITAQCIQWERRRCEASSVPSSSNSSAKITSDVKVIAKVSHPSVEVAKLRKLEMSYAEVLKVALNRVANKDRMYN